MFIVWHSHPHTTEAVVFDYNSLGTSIYIEPRIHDDIFKECHHALLN